MEIVKPIVWSTRQGLQSEIWRGNIPGRKNSKRKVSEAQHGILAHSKNSITFGYIPSKGMAGSYGSSIFSFWRNLHNIFHCDCTNLYSHQQGTSVPFSSHLCEHVLSLLLLLLSCFSRVRLCNPIDGSPLGSSVSGILQARTLEWVAIAFSNARK